MSENQKGARSFARFFEQIAGGGVHTEASVELFRLTEKLKAHAEDHNTTAQGEITISLKIGVLPNGQSQVTADIKTKLPKAKRHPAVAWLDETGNLGFANPTALPLFPRAVEGAPVVVTQTKPEEQAPARAL
jgi:hypothetical protein